MSFEKIHLLAIRSVDIRSVNLDIGKIGDNCYHVYRREFGIMAVRVEKKGQSQRI